MATTFILHGGKTSVESPQNSEFFRQFTETVNQDKVRIVLCYWARPQKEWQSLFVRDKSRILNQASKKVEIFLAQDVADLYAKLEQANVLYVAGGEPTLIEPYIAQLSQLKEKLSGKVYLGSSMGVFIVSKNYVTSFAKESSVQRGLGILPLNLLCHWDVDKRKEFKIKLLQKAAAQFPILLLDEKMFVKFVF